MDKLACMATFVRVVEKGSFVAAAAGTGLTATMIGNHVRYLEARLGSRLVNRTTRRQSVTEVGRDYYERCRHILAEVEVAEGFAADAQAAPRGLLRVTAPVTLGVSLLPRLLSEYLDAFPAIDVDLVLDDRAANLLDEGFEAAIRVGKMDDPALISRPLAPYRIVLCAAPRYLERRGTPLTVADLAEHNCLDFALSGLRGTWHFEGRAQAAPRGRLRANNGLALRAAALVGMGIVNLPEVIVADDLASGSLVQLLPECTPPGRPMHLLTISDRRPTPKLRSFVDFFKSRLAAG